MIGIINQKEAMKLHEILDSYFNKLLTKQHLSSIVLNEVTTFRRLSSILNFLIYLTCFAYISTPIGFIIYQYLHKIHPIKYPLVLPAVYPWKIKPNGIVYILHYIQESSAVIGIIVTTGGTDSLFTLYIFQLIAQIREMSFRILRSSENNDHTIVRECMKQYENLLEAKSILQQIYGPIILWTVLVNGISLCSQMFDFVQVHIRDNCYLIKSKHHDCEGIY